MDAIGMKDTIPIIEKQMEKIRFIIQGSRDQGFRAFAQPPLRPKP